MGWIALRYEKCVVMKRLMFESFLICVGVTCEEKFRRAKETVVLGNDFTASL